MFTARSEERLVTMSQAGDVADEDLLRSRFYGFLAEFLSAPPGEAELGLARTLAADGTTPLGAAMARLERAARATSAAQEADAYQDLFIGLGRGILVPYGSYYLTGFLHEKPLARLRQDMAVFGIAPQDGVSEPEDHIASVLEMMAGLVEGRFGAVAPAEQRRFFEAHVGAWAPHFFRDLSLTEPSEFYAALGDVGSRFMEIEERAFRLA